MASQTPPPFDLSTSTPSVPPHRSSRPFNLLRRRVSVNKRRHVDDGWDLDLTYITPRIIALGFPALRAGTRWWRNRMEDVSAFMTEKHSTDARIYNLCVEDGWGYSPDWFAGNAVTYGMIDKHPPPLPLVLACIQDMYAWLRADPKHVVAVHCRAGKGRTGTVISCFLLYAGMCQHGEAALDLFDRTRTAYGLAVNLPSQRRTVKLFGELMRLGIISNPNAVPCGVVGGVLPAFAIPSRAMIVRRVTISGWEGQTRPLLKIVLADVKDGSMVHVVLHEERGVEVSHSVVFTFAAPVVVDGLFGVEVFDNRFGRPHREAAAWVHTICAQPGNHFFTAQELDGPHKKFKVKGPNREIVKKEKVSTTTPLSLTLQLDAHNPAACPQMGMGVGLNCIGGRAAHGPAHHNQFSRGSGVGFGYCPGNANVVPLGACGGGAGRSGNFLVPVQSPLLVSA